MATSQATKLLSWCLDTDSNFAKSPRAIMSALDRLCPPQSMSSFASVDGAEAVELAMNFGHPILTR